MVKKHEPKLLKKTRAAIAYARKRPNFSGRFYDSSQQRGEPATIFIDGGQLTVISFYGSDILHTIKDALSEENGSSTSKIEKLLGTNTGFTIQITLA